MEDSMKFSNTLDTDFKLEVVIASLVKQGYDQELIRILRDGASRRYVSKEIEKVYEKYNDDNFKKYLHIHVNREGIYDILPEGIFHKTTYKRSYKDIQTDVEKALDEIKIHREQEFFARRFFQLFEQIVDNTLVEICQTEIRYDHKVTNREFTDLFIQYWPVLRRLEHRQAVTFMYLIPLLSKIRLNLEEVGESLSFILDVPVKIEMNKLPAKKADRQFESHLGRVGLGMDLVLGNTFDDGINDLKLTIGYLSADRMRGFLETAPERIVLNMLLEIFLPNEIFPVVDFKIDPEDSKFIVSDENHSTYLGLNSFI